MTTIAPAVTTAPKSISLAEKLSRFAYPCGAALVIFGGLIPRLDHIGQSLWADEAWVADSVLTGTVREMFYYDKWLQTTPPLFLLLVRATVRLFGLSDYSLRAVPFAFSILALVLLALLARKMFSAPLAIFCTSLVALSPPAIVFAKELKQYSADLAATCLVLLALWDYLQRPDRKRYAKLLVIFSVTLFLSYTSVVFAPLALVVLAFLPHNQQSPLTLHGRLARTAGFLFLVSTISVLNYFLFIQPNSSPVLSAFWAHGLPSFTHIADAVHFYVEKFLAIGIYFYFPAQSLTKAKDVLESSILSLPGAIQGAVLIISAVLVALAIKAFSRKRSYRYAALFFFVPLLTFAGLNLVRMYPAGTQRLTLFLLPSVAIVTTAALEALWQTFFAKLAPPDIAKAILAGAAALCVIVVLVLGYRAAGSDVYVTQEEEDTESAFRYLKSHVQPNDILYVHASVEEPARLYSKMLRWDNLPIRYGHTGWPCCTRTVELRPQDPLLQRAYVVQDFDQVTTGRTAGALWLVFTERATHWNYLALDESAIITSRLLEAGCQRELEQHFENEVVDKFQCAH